MELMQSGEIRLSRLHQCTFEQALKLKNRGFEGYYTEVTITMNQLLSSMAILEVVTKNTHAISAYESGGFCIADKLVGMTGPESFMQPFYNRSLPNSMQLHYGKPADAAGIPFYRDKSAWECMWHNLKEGESLTVSDTSGKAIAYALFHRSRTANGQLSSINLYQCEVDPSCKEKDDLFRILLHEVYGQFNVPYLRETVNLSMSHPELILILQEAGFKTNYEQYLMILEKQSSFTLNEKECVF